MIYSPIEWCIHTFNLWWGCIKVHTGCKNCYAEAWSNRFGKKLWGVRSKRERKVNAFKELAKMQKNAAKKNEYPTVFVGSMMDIFEDSQELLNPSDEFTTTGQLRDKLFENIREGLYSNLVFLFLTKRPENINKILPEWMRVNCPKNIWYGTSVVDQITYDNAVPELLKVNSNNLFLSCEPQLNMITLSSKHKDRIGWIIQGGESGKKRRPFELCWAESMKQQCLDMNIPYFFKQIDKVQIPPDYLINSREFPAFKYSFL